MGIGTSLGAYFEDGFNHSAGVQAPDAEVLKPKDTGDDNVLPPEDNYEVGGGNKSDILQIAEKQDTIQVNPMITTENPEVHIMIGGSQMRRGANENLPEGHPDRPYNIREPDMIGSKEQDDHIDRTWANFGKKQKILDQMEAINSRGKLSEFEKAQYERLKQQHDEIE